MRTFSNTELLISNENFRTDWFLKEQLKSHNPLYISELPFADITVNSSAEMASVCRGNAQIRPLASTRCVCSRSPKRSAASRVSLLR